MAEPFIDGLHFGECPRWHHGRLWFVDFYDGTVQSSDEDGTVRVELEVPGEPAGIGWMPDGRLLVVSRKLRTVLRLEADGELVEHGDLKPTATFYGNDMVVDAAGRAYVGNFGFDLDLFIEERERRRWWRPPAPRPPAWSGSTRTDRPTSPPTTSTFPTERSSRRTGRP